MLQKDLHIESTLMEARRREAEAEAASGSAEAAGSRPLLWGSFLQEWDALRAERELTTKDQHLKELLLIERFESRFGEQEARWAERLAASASSPETHGAVQPSAPSQAAPAQPSAPSEEGAVPGVERHGHGKSMGTDLAPVALAVGGPSVPGMSASLIPECQHIERVDTPTNARPSPMVGKRQGSIKHVLSAGRVYGPHLADRVDAAKDRFYLRWWVNLEEPRRTGPLARVVNSHAFDMCAHLIIVLTCINTVLVTNHAARHLEEEPQHMQIASIVCSCLYILEVSMKIMVHRWFFFVAKDMGWNIMDFVLSLSEAWNLILLLLMAGGGSGISFMRAFRILKITRVLRLIRFMTVFRELRLLLDAMSSSIATVFWCAIFIYGTLAVFALIFTQMTTEYRLHGLTEGDGCGLGGLDADLCETYKENLLMYFADVQTTSLTLFMATSGGNDWALFYDSLVLVGPDAQSAFVSFTFFFQFGVFNLLTSMFVDQAMKNSKPDIDAKIIEQRTNELQQAQELMQECNKFDVNGDGRITYREFKVMVQNEAMSTFLAAEGLDIADAEMFFFMLQAITGEKDGSVPIDKFVQGSMRMKGPATSIDMQALHFHLQQLSEKVKRLERAGVVDMPEQPTGRLPVSLRHIQIETEELPGVRLPPPETPTEEPPQPKLKVSM